MRALHVREAAGALGPGVEGVAQALRQAVDERGDRVLGDLEVLAARPAVEPLGVAPDGGEPVALDLGQHRRHGLDDLRVGLGRHVGALGGADDGVGTSDPASVGRGQVHTYNLGIAERVWQPLPRLRRAIVTQR